MAAPPPGRSGRLWLRRRVALAHRGAQLLDRKVRILRSERDRARAATQAAARRWHRAAAEADTWLLRAGVLGGERALRLHAPPGPARVRLAWRDVMGVRVPEVDGFEAAGPSPQPPGTAALVDASVAVRRALRSAADHAAAAAAEAAIEAELVETTRRLRAITQRWVPRLEEQLRLVSAQLEENDRAEAVRLRWAAGGHGGEATRHRRR